MKAVIRSFEDRASINIGKHLEGLLDFEYESDCFDLPMLKWNDWRLISTEWFHIESEHLDRRVSDEIGETPELMVFLSRHRSESGMHSLTVHPPGNPVSADFGGTPGALPPSAPDEMTSALRNLFSSASGLEYDVTFEVTHHGPSLDTPSFFIEIGSSESEWMDPSAGLAVARAVAGVMEGHHKGARKLIGIGGGHYAPRFTEVAQKYDASFGHMIANYHHESFSEEMFTKAFEGTGADGAYVHRKSMKSAQKRSAMEILETLGIESLRAGDLNPLG